MLYTIENDFLTITVDSFGAQIHSVKSADGYEYMWQGEKYWEDHAPVLFPTCGNLPGLKYTYRGNEYKLPIHGLVMYRESELVEKTDTRLKFKFVSDDETFAGFPFCFELNVVFEISGKTLTTKIIPKNTDEKVDTSKAGATLVIADGTENNIKGANVAVDVEMQDGSKRRFIDYASAGATWGKDSEFKIWNF